jgi:hypothetical protein
VIQLSPPLICDSEQFQEIHDVLRPVLEEAAEQVERRGSEPASVRQERRGG